MKLLFGAATIALLGSSVAATAVATPVAQTADAVLAANHAAVGKEPENGTAVFAYAYSSSGLSGTLTDVFNLETGAYVETESTEGIDSATGYNGKIPWQRDISGATTDQQGGDRIAIANNIAYRFANLWWRPGHGGAVVSYVAREIENGRSFDHLAVTPKNGKRFDAWFDADTHRLDHTQEDRQFIHVRTIYGDYRRTGTLMLPNSITVDEGSGPANFDLSNLRRANFGRAKPNSAYTRPTARPTGASIADGAASTTVPFRFLNNHIYVEATVNGKGPYTFIVDTGGHTLLSPKIVSDLGLKPVGAATANGAGEGHETTGFVRFHEIAIGDVSLRDETGFAISIYDKSIEGIPVDGMVGFELIRRMVTQIDYGRHVLTFIDPRKFRPSKALGTPVPFVFYDHMPDVAGSVLGSPARFTIDTGSRSEIDFTSPFVATHDLKTRFNKGVTAVTGWGVGGPARSYVVRLSGLKLGQVQVDNIAAGLSEAKAGTFSDPNFDGNIGSALLKRFVVTFDYAHQTMYLAPISALPIDVGTFDRSGLWINAQDDGFQIVDVAKGSVGAEAGLAVGDVIVSIDGKPVVAQDLSTARQLLRTGSPGTEVKLIVRRGSDSRPVSLILRDQI